MKKIILAISLFAAVSFSANAQKSDAFFTSNYNYEQNRESSVQGGWADVVGLPGHNSSSNEDAPLGSGLLLLGGMALGYAAMRKRK